MEGEGFSAMDLWQLCTPFFSLAFMVINFSNLGLPAGSGKSVLWYAISQLLRDGIIKICLYCKFCNHWTLATTSTDFAAQVIYPNKLTCVGELCSRNSEEQVIITQFT